MEVLREQGRDSWRGVADLRQRRRVREDALKRKTMREAELPDFVSDKTAIDYLAYWLQNQSEHEERFVNQAFLDDCQAAASRYDVIVLLPYRDQVDYAIGRNQDPIHNLKVAAHKLGLLQILAVPHVHAPYQFGEELSAWIATWLTPLLPAADATRSE